MNDKCLVRWVSLRSYAFQRSARCNGVLDGGRVRRANEIFMGRKPGFHIFANGTQRLVKTEFLKQFNWQGD